MFDWHRGKVVDFIFCLPSLAAPLLCFFMPLFPIRCPVPGPQDGPGHLMPLMLWRDRFGIQCPPPDSKTVPDTLCCSAAAGASRHKVPSARLIGPMAQHPDVQFLVIWIAQQSANLQTFEFGTSTRLADVRRMSGETPARVQYF